jgi:hypothetical protein
LSQHPSQLSDDERLVVSPRRARHLLDCGTTRLYQLIAERELDSFLDGRSRKISVESIRAYIARRLAPAGESTASPPRRRVRPPGASDAGDRTRGARE